MMTSEPSLVGLIQRADWTQLSLSAEANDGSSLLLSPGNRYRFQTQTRRTGCDGGRPWELIEDEPYSEGVHWVSGPEAPMPRLLCPAWLLDSSVLQMRGETQAFGRQAFDVLMTPRPSLRTAPLPDRLARPVEVRVDAESGILLRVAELGPRGDQQVLELVRADFAPSFDAAQFQPPSGSRTAESFGQSFGDSAAWRVATTVGGLAAGALGAWMKYSPFRRTENAEAEGVQFEATITPDEPGPDRTGTEPQVSDELLGLIHAGGPTNLGAAMHQWLDLGALTSSVPGSARRAGLGGIGLLMDAISDRPSAGHTVSSLRLAASGVYQIEGTHRQRRRPTTVGSDGQRSWRVYTDNVTTGPPEPPPRLIGRLADPSWLLAFALSGGEQVAVNDRRSYRITVAPRKGAERSLLLPFAAAVAVIDAELGIILRLTSYIGEKPVERYELREITTDLGDFHPAIPAGIPIVDEPHRFQPWT